MEIDAWKKFGRFIKKNWFIALCAICVIFLIVFNAFRLRSKFLETSLSSCITLLVAIIISYLYSQKENNKRKQKDILLDLMMSIKNTISESSVCKIDPTMDKSIITMRNRDIGNKMDLLERYKNEFGFSEDFDGAKKQFEEYRSTIDNHIDDLDYLSKSELELKRPITLMDNKIFEAMLKLYK